MYSEQRCKDIERESREMARNKGTKLTRRRRFVNVLFLERLPHLSFNRPALTGTRKLYNNIPKAITKVSRGTAAGRALFSSDYAGRNVLFCERERMYYSNVCCIVKVVRVSPDKYIYIYIYIYIPHKLQSVNIIIVILITSW
jgi:hypothetical protein